MNLFCSVLFWVQVYVVWVPPFYEHFGVRRAKQKSPKFHVSFLSTIVSCLLFLSLACFDLPVDYLYDIDTLWSKDIIRTHQYS
jgi:hypothetical protein